MGEVEKRGSGRVRVLCPKCGSRARRVSRTFWERVRLKGTLGKWECNHCYNRFFASREAFAGRD